MKRLFYLSLIFIAAACAGPKFDPAAVADANDTQVAHVEPLSWWTGMKTPLQLLINGEGVSAYDVTIEGGKGVSVRSRFMTDRPSTSPEERM